MSSSASCATRSRPSTGRTSERSSSTGRPSDPHRGTEMDFNKLTIKSGEAVAGAQELARRMGNPELTPDHLAIALLDQELVRTLVESAGASVDELRSEAELRLRSLPSVSGTNAQPHASAALSRVLDAAFDEMRELGDDYVSVEH